MTYFAPFWPLLAPERPPITQYWNFILKSESGHTIMGKRIRNNRKYSLIIAYKLDTVLGRILQNRDFEAKRAISWKGRFSNFSIKNFLRTLQYFIHIYVPFKIYGSSLLPQMVELNYIWLPDYYSRSLGTSK